MKKLLMTLTVALTVFAVSAQTTKTATAATGTVKPATTVAKKGANSKCCHGHCDGICTCHSHCDTVTKPTVKATKPAVKKSTKAAKPAVAKKDTVKTVVAPVKK